MKKNYTKLVSALCYFILCPEIIPYIIPLNSNYLCKIESISDPDPLRPHEPDPTDLTDSDPSVPQ